ncbi:hypothetical protein EVAR_99871_1, partial [Eumeta japonica]
NHTRSATSDDLNRNSLRLSAHAWAPGARGAGAHAGRRRPTQRGFYRYVLELGMSTRRFLDSIAAITAL